MTYGVDHGAAGMGEALDKLCKRAEAAVRAGENIIILSDRATGPTASRFRRCSPPAPCTII